MSAELLALGAALCWAAGSVVTKLATRTGTFLQGAVVGLAVGTLAVGILFAATADQWTVPVLPAVLFLFAGLVGPGCGRIVAMRAVRDVGVSVAVPIQTSSTPLIATVAGVVLFKEDMNPARFAALTLIVMGIWACARGGSANRDEARNIEAAVNRAPRRFILLIWPLVGGAAFATSDVLRKAAVDRNGDPMLGALVGLSAALIVWIAILTLRPSLRTPLRFNAAFAWFCAHGLLAAAAVILALMALRLGDLSRVAPIFGSQLVIALLLGALVLRDIEIFRPLTIAGTVLVFLGVTIITIT